MVDGPGADSEVDAEVDADEAAPLAIPDDADDALAWLLGAEAVGDALPTEVVRDGDALTEGEAVAEAPGQGVVDPLAAPVGVAVLDVVLDGVATGEDVEVDGEDVEDGVGDGAVDPAPLVETAELAEALPDAGAHGAAGADELADGVPAVDAADDERDGEADGEVIPLPDALAVDVVAAVLVDAASVLATGVAITWASSASPPRPWSRKRAYHWRTSAAYSTDWL